MQCIRRGLPRAAVRPDDDVNGALQRCLGSSSVDAVVALLHLASNIEGVSTQQHEIPYSCGDTIDVVGAVSGALGDRLELRDACPLPTGNGGAVNVVVETAGELLSLAFDSLEQACFDAMEHTETCALESLAGSIPLQSLLLLARVSFAKSVDAALSAESPVAAALAELSRGAEAAAEAVRSAAASASAAEDSSRARAALDALLPVLREQQALAAALAGAAEASTEAAERLWASELRLYFVPGAGEAAPRFEARCASCSLPVSFGYDPRRPLEPAANGADDAYALARRCRRSFAEAFDFGAGRPKVLLVSDRSGAGRAALVRDVCAMLNVVPLELDGASLTDGDTFWQRATAAARSGGSALPLLVVREATRAKRDVLDAAVAACAERGVALCMAYDPDVAVDYQIAGCAGSRHILVEI